MLTSRLFGFFALLSLSFLIFSNPPLLSAIPEEASSTRTHFRVLTLFSKPTNQDGRLPAGQVGVDLLLSQAPQDLQALVEVIHHPISRSVTEMANEVLQSIQRYRPDFIIGGNISNQAFVISDLAESMGIPYITPSATHPAITENKRSTFRVCFDDNYQAAKIADFIFHDLGFSRGFIIYDRSETFAVGVESNFSKRFESIGGSVLDRISYEKERELSEIELAKIADRMQGAQFVFLPNYQLGTAAIMSKMISLFPKDLVYVGPDSWGGSALIQSVVDGGNQDITAYFVEHWSKEYETKENLNFQRLLDSASIDARTKQILIKGESRSAFALGYDAMGVVIEAIKLLQRNSIPIPTAIRQVKFEGSTGTIDFSGGHTPEKGLFIYKFNSGNKEFVKAYR